MKDFKGKVTVYRRRFRYSRKIYGGSVKTTPFSGVLPFYDQEMRRLSKAALDESIMLTGEITWMLNSLELYGYGDFERLNDFYRAMFTFDVEKGFNSDRYEKVLL